MSTQKTNVKSKGSVRPLLLATSVIGFVAILLSIIAGLFKSLKDEMGSDFPIKSGTINDLHLGVGILVIAGFVCAMVFIALRKRYNSTEKRLNTKNMVIINSVFWGVALALTILLAIKLLERRLNIDFDVNKTTLCITVWFTTALMLVPPSVMNVIAFTKSK